jgi:hypothetical protein
MVNEVFPTETAASVLTTARKAKKPWYELARIIEAGVEGVPAADRPSAIAAFGQAGGVAPSVAKRYVRLLERMREIGGEMGAAEGELLSDSFNAQELAERIYRTSKDEGADVFRRVARGEFTLPALREIQARNQNTGLRYLAGDMRLAANRIVESAFKNDGPRIFGERCVIRRRPKLWYIGNIGHEVIAEDGSIVAGTDTLFPDPRTAMLPERDALDRLLARSLALAPFFPKFYLVYAFSGGEDDWAGRTVELLDWLRYDWIGVLVAWDEQNLREMRPSTGSPVPDLTARYDFYVRKYLISEPPMENPMGYPPRVHSTS